MRRGFLILGLGVTAAVATYFCVYLAGTTGPRTWLQNRQPELVWLKQEFKLSDAEFARVSQLHEAYLPQCRERCSRIRAMNDKLAQLLAANSDVTPAVESALAERATMRSECQTAMLKHFFEVSRTMSPEQGRRYLAWVQEQTCLREQTMNHGEAPRADTYTHAGN
jgi:hypothetical protein